MKYIIADEDHELWGHFFEEDGEFNERHCRFVYDSVEEELHKLEINRDNRWQTASRNDYDNLEDSLKNANPQALDNPEEWGLGQSDSVPPWGKSEMTPDDCGCE